MKKVLTFLIFIIITQAKYTKKLERFNDEFRDEVIRKNNLAQEMVNNFLQIIAANIIKNTYRRIKKSEENFNNKWIKLTSETKLSYSIVYALNTAMNAAILSIGGILVIRENLCVSENIKDKDIIRILEKVCLGDWYYKLERGLDTNLGDNGVKISGGERQRIAMARALLRNSSIILLDEATSMLDEKTESQIIDLISKLFDGKTLIMITHKKSIAKKMENVIEIKNGSIEFIDKYVI